MVLLHDEMSIKEDLVFDSKTGDLVGLVNIRKWEESGDSKTVASRVLVLYVVGLNSNLKSSLGFFGTRTATADELDPIFWEAVGFLELSCNVKVIA